jgi:hypothetical protein
MEVNKFDCFVTPKEDKLQCDYMFLNSWQNTINKIDFNYTTNKKLDQSVGSKSTIKKVEDYLKFESSLKFNFEEIEYEKLKLKWKETIEVVQSDSFSYLVNRSVSTQSMMCNVIIYNVLIILLLGAFYIKTQVDNFIESIVYRPLFRYELIFHTNINDYIKYR